MDKEKESMEKKVIPGMGSEEGYRPTGGPIPNADTKVAVPRKRRRFTKAYKLSILDTVAKLKNDNPGKLGGFLRSEGLYYSIVSKWRNQQHEGTLSEHRKGTVVLP